MAFFTRGGDGGPVEGRSREYLLRGSPLVARDRQVVLADVTIRFDPAPRPGDLSAPAWDSADEVVVEGVALALLRLVAEEHDSADLLVERSILADPLGRAITYAPVATRFAAEVTTLELRGHDPTVRWHSQWRGVA